MTAKPNRPPITFIPMSTDAEKIRFFGTLMPALLLLRASPLRFLQYQIVKRQTPRGDLAGLIEHGADDVARSGDMLIFVHRWQSLTFDPFTFARAKTFLAQAGRLARRAGYAATLLDPLSPDVNLPRLAASAGLGNLSPYGLLVHPIFGPRVILTGLQTACPWRCGPAGAAMAATIAWPASRSARRSHSTRGSSPCATAKAARNAWWSAPRARGAASGASRRRWPGARAPDAARVSEAGNAHDGAGANTRSE